MSTSAARSPSVVAVCGMHRSGTSMFARFLHHAGIDMGERLYSDLTTNPYGHYEDLDFLTLQRLELARAFDGEDYLVAEDFPLAEGFRESARELLERRQADADGAWGWKDPRTSVFLPLWKELVPDLRAVALLRSPRGVLDSLCRRLRAYWSPGRKAHILRTYTHYNRSLLAFGREHPANLVVVPLERLIERPEDVLPRVGEALERDLDPALFRELFDPEAMSKSRRAGVLFNRRELEQAEAIRDQLLAAHG